jgi:hypothetical protein
MPWGLIGVIAVVVILIWYVVGATTAGTGNTPSTPSGCDGCHTLRAWWNSLKAGQKVVQFANWTARKLDCAVRCKINV